MSTLWKQLVLRYADGRPPCNCGDAWYYPCGVGIDAEGHARKDMLACKHGCSANIIAAKHEIAARMWAEIQAKQDTKAS